MTRIETNLFYDSILEEASELDKKNNTGDEALRMAMRKLASTDRFYLGTRVLKRIDADTDWVYKRAREVEANPDGFLDLWAREHYKSTIITFWGSIQEIINDPEITIVIFSFNKAIAKAFLKMIMKELEENETLKWLFPEIFWANPKKDSRKYGFSWSSQEGICVKRETNPNEQTIEAHGLIDAQPTSKHFMLRIYNDVVTDKTCLTQNMRDKATDGWKLSQNLGRSQRDVDAPGRMWHEGTIYHPYDTYNYIKRTGEVQMRVYPATEDGTVLGKPVFMSKAELGIKYKIMGPYIFAAQMLLDPLQESKQGFEEDWINYWPAEIYKNLNIMLICDPASKKGKDNDYTVFFVIGLGPDNNYYVIDFVRDKLSLTERATVLFRMQQKYNPVFTGYEEVAMQTDREHFEYVMDQHNYRFHITPMHESTNKQARILSLVPLFEQGRIFFPEKLPYMNWEGRPVDLVERFIEEEFSIFPFVEHDDMLDCLAKVNHKDVFVPFPEGEVMSLYIDGDADYENDEEEFDVYAC